MFAFLMTLLALPLLGLISIPLILSAWLTISFAMFTLLLRFAVVYTELCYAMVLSFFTLPTSSSSFLTFAPSEPATPAVGNSRRNSGYGLIPYRQNNDTLSSWALNALHDDPAKLRKKSYARSMVEAHHLPTTPFMGLPISGDERRDFEGVGGWRSYPDPSRASRPRTSHSFQEKPLSSDASSPAPSATGIADVNVDVDADERAWLSLNDRLELPSQVITFGIGSSMSSAVNSPTGMDFFRANSHTAVPNSSRLHHSRHSGRNRHHHRSHTTSALTASDNRTGSGLSLAFSTRPDPTVSPPAAQLAPFMTPQPYSPTHTRSQHLRSNAYSSSFADGPSSSLLASSGGSFGSGSSGYFALQRPGAVASRSNTGTPSGSGRTTPGTGASNEERDASSLGLTRLMFHYSTSMRHRRRSISGPHARVTSIGERLG